MKVLINSIKSEYNLFKLSQTLYLENYDIIKI